MNAISRVGKAVALLVAFIAPLMIGAAFADTLNNISGSIDDPSCDRMLRREAILQNLKETGRQGTKGRLVFENNSFSVAIFESDEHNGPNAQILVDAADSAAWFMWFESQSPIVADHCTQGFGIIKRCVPGDYCYIVDGDSYQKYQCVAVDPNGTNERTDMYLSDGYNFMRENDPGYLYMYTCNNEGDYYHITVAIWIPIEEDDE